MRSAPLPRAISPLLEDALRRNPVVALVGARQCGKTTLARQFVAADSPNYFDLEDPLSLARLDEPMTALVPLTGLVVIDEVQRRPDLFPILRVLADRDENPARYLVLGSAGPDLLRQSAESLAGRIEYLELTGLQAAELGGDHLGTLWLRGGFPRSLLAGSDEDSRSWRKSYVQTFVERDLPQFGAGLAAPVTHRLVLMLAHYHAQMVNVRALATALGISETTVRRYLDLLEQLFLIRQLRPWHENLSKRQVKRPKLYFRDSGLFHHLIGTSTMDELLTDPRLGASWEGFVLEKTIAEAHPDQAHFWGTHGGAELDLLMFVKGRRIGVEIKRADAPRRTPSMTAALRDLSLDALCVVYPGNLRYKISDRMTAVPAAEYFSADDFTHTDAR
ncbi:ATP-binding protein [Candidatus Poriferisodalis sp.]|uniref:ATP-binding protein n=1 Tax=Candidatus Poriferisodalis sp. TaxID=3101277 RepID=UPI003B024E0D